ncbi:ParB/RepB/Spo0J family partition protein [Crossiella cryophila]|uniref:ParB-like N-terminal domain-containing protein n=1 Tax=Crossiella cryophila TaxID=43355 RepID=A0A7W7CER1_9PSEU|nr:ParB/RepB/Spo0J family partition protein [Crossiella cryophila]MBB4678184.1 hypothetical protein [Crossiella cryophila]
MDNSAVPAWAPDGVPVTVAVSQLDLAGSPRVSGENPEHVKVLAGMAGLPPILVHRPSMRVIDGAHRLRAAVLNGERTIEVRYFDGDDRAAFVLGVRANVAHGLPLSLAERKAAAVRIMGLYPDWSDRAVATSAGLAAKTVAKLRRVWQPGPAAPPVRVGLDGRSRPLDAAAGRRKAAALIGVRPDASLREIAGLAGVSPQTVSDVRDRLRAGRSPVPGTGAPRRGYRRDDGPHDPMVALREIRRDPSLRFTENGRQLLRWVEANLATPTGWSGLLDSVPAHWAPVLSALARDCSAALRQFAEELEQLDRPDAVPARRS